MNKFYPLKVLEIEPLTAESVKIVLNLQILMLLILKLVNTLPYAKKLTVKT